MANMSYCRFENTYRDLVDCITALEQIAYDNESISEREWYYAKRMRDLCEQFVEEFDDYYSEGDVYGELPHELDEENECTTYFVTYDDIKRGLERAADGTFNAGNDKWTEQTKRSARVSFDSFMDEDRCDFDLVSADILMQIILFDEIIYG